ESASGGHHQAMGCDPRRSVQTRAGRRKDRRSAAPGLAVALPSRDNSKGDDDRSFRLESVRRRWDRTQIDEALLNVQVLIEGKLSVRKVILNRPRKLNCLTFEMQQEGSHSRRMAYAEFLTRFLNLAAIAGISALEDFKSI
ncbi:hypothetical protein Ancab_001106, partial [Ancistrocladus abbreviatus]